MNLTEVLKTLGRFFYIVKPSDTYYENPGDVPNFISEGIPFIVGFLLLEYLVLWLRGKSLPRINNGISSFSNGLIQVTGKIISRGAESMCFLYIHKHWKLVDLAWDSPWTWFITALCVDFVYYWHHRAGHEVNLFWAAHQVHHSAEDYNLTTAVRRAYFQGWFESWFYLPMAFFAPPAQWVVHQQFNLLYQFWIHTEAIDNLGPLEYILNTPSHHRVHHSANKYCIDKNYGGVLIIWDRLFGTFEAERKGETLVYGLITTERTFNPLWHQFFYYGRLWKKYKEMDNWGDKLAVFWKGPAWTPGKPRLGLEEDLPDIKYREKYDVQLPTWRTVYLLLHFIIILHGYTNLVTRELSLAYVPAVMFSVYIISSLSIIGLVLDNKPYACAFELIRCFIFVLYIQNMAATELSPKLFILQAYFIASAVYWMIEIINSIDTYDKNRLRDYLKIEQR